MASERIQATLELLYHVSRELATALELRTVLQRILSLSLANVGGERGSIVVLDDRGQPVDATIVIGARMTDHSTQQLKETVDRGLAGWVVKNGKPALVPDTSRDSRWLRRADDDRSRSGAKSAVCVPLLARERLVGVLTIVHGSPGFFNEEHMALMQAIADQAGIAVLNARFYDESQRQARVMTALAESAVTLNASLHLDQVLQRILDQTGRALQAQVVLLALVDEVHQQLIYRAAVGDIAQKVIGYRLPIGQGVAGRVASEGRGVIVGRVAPAGIDQLPGLKVHSLICAPVHTHGRINGVLEIVNPLEASQVPESLYVLTGIGSLAGVAIDNAQLYERLEATNRRYRELFEDSIDPILITDFAGKIIEANLQASQITGYGLVILEKQAIHQLFEPDQEKVGGDLTQLAANETVSFETTLKKQNGDVIAIEVHVHRVKIDYGDSLQWILRDISDRKELAGLQENLIAMVYHDLRTPLANVVSSLDLLNSMLPPQRDPGLNSTLAIANRSTDRMQRLVSSLLDIHRLEAGQPLTNLDRYSPWLLARDAQESVYTVAESKKQTITLALKDDLPAVMVDEDMVRRVLINLVENATKYTPLGGHIQIGASLDGHWLEMWVEDDGPGIPENEHEHIFDKYTRLNRNMTVKGLGLGLAFCRLAVQAHGGRIWVESKSPSGSRFVFTLPVAEKTVTAALKKTTS